MAAAATDIQPFTVDIPDAALDDLRDRLSRTLWPDEVDGVGWEYGVPRSYVQELSAYWRDEFDWREHESKLNAFPQFVTSIDGERIHFVHVTSPEKDALPLIVTHGWPMSIFEYLDLIGPLTDPRDHGADPADAFHLVVPSLPGVAFSGPTTQRGWGTDRIARAWVELMDRLGYRRYGAHGNDVGSQVSPEVGRNAPDHVAGAHVTQIFAFPSGDPTEFADLSEDDQAALAFLERFSSGGGLAYNQYQSAQPQTLAYALQDSPAGWLAWVTQLFRDAVDPEFIVTNAAAYWLTGTVGSSIRRYYEDAHPTTDSEAPTTVPIGLANFAYDFQSIRRFADRDHANIVSWNRYPSGSHFATHDAPELLVEDIRRFFRDLR
jgi:pimeloyl-ACP methyl ester carboxylesterase